MRFSLDRTESECFTPIYENTLTAEESAELVIPDIREDVGKILDIRGQVVLSSKKLMTDAATVMASVCACVIYLSDSGEKIECVSAEIPFEMDIAAVGIDEESVIVSDLRLCDVEVKMLNSRKLLFRARVSAVLRCYAPDVFSICNGLPEDVMGMNIHLLKKRAEHNLVAGLREKTFAMSDEYSLPNGIDPTARLLCTETGICVDDVKMVGNKLVFKARAVTDAIFLKDGDCSLQLGTFESMFSQIIEVDREGEELEPRVSIELMSADFTRLPENTDMDIAATFRISATAVCVENVESDYIADAYSNCRPLELEGTSVELTTMLPPKKLHIQLEGSLPEAVMDAKLCYLSISEASTLVNGGRIDINATARGVAETEDGGYIPVEAVLKGDDEIVLSDGQSMRVIEVFCGETEVGRSGSLSSEAVVCVEITGTYEIDTVCAVEYDEECSINDLRPSLTVLCSDSHGGDLWSLAKKYGSTVEAIERANTIEGEFSPLMRPLLVPKAK